MTTTTNRYVDGLYAPVSTEVTAFDLPITGVLPPELDGRYLRNGPNPIGPVDPATHHWFVGDGMVHGIRLRDGCAEWYRNRWIRSDAVSAALGEEPPPAGRDGQRSVANTNVIGLGSKTFAIVEAGGPPAELTDELDTVCFSTFDGTLQHGFTAHPKRDPRTGELHTANYFWARPDVVDYTVVGPDGRVVHQADIDVPGNPMVHDCSITETSMVIYDLPCTFDLDAAMGGAKLPYRWNESHGARLGVLPLGGESSEVRWFDIEPCYVFHPINAFDDGDRIIIDVVRHPKMFDQDHLGPNEGPPVIWRYELDRSTGRATERQLDDVTVEFPRVDERMVGRHHRFSWATMLDMDEAAGGVSWPGTALIRHDASTQQSQVHQFGAGRTVGEGVFVPRSEDAAEDDGWYLTLVHDAATDLSELVVLDGQDWLGDPVATVQLPVRVPLGFHGNWVAAD